MLLKNTDAYFKVYILVGIIGMIPIFLDDYLKSTYDKKLLNLMSLVFPVVILLSNYQLFKPIGKHLLSIAFVAVVSFYIARNILILLIEIMTMCSKSLKSDKQNKIKPQFLFLIVFIILAIIYTTYLITVAYPGSLSDDSMAQICQILHRIPLSNHHPFYHTLVIKIMLNIGTSLFGDINAGIALYSFLSLVMMSAIFSFVIMSVYEVTGNLKMPLFMLMLYAILPYHITYSVTMWKDVFFGGGVALFVASVIRLYWKIGNKSLNNVFLILGGLLFGLFRSNGWVALALSFLCVLFFWRPKELIIIMIGLLTMTFILKHPVLSLLNVKQPDIVEYLSIPEQQIARVYAEGVTLTDDEVDLIGKAADIDTLTSDYDPYISDPVKINIRSKGVEYLSDHKLEYLKLWIGLGIKYPTIYLESWIDQTKGYWNAGYEYWIWHVGIIDESLVDGEWVSSSELGLKRENAECFISGIFRWWLIKFAFASLFEPLRSLGLHVWMFMFSLLAAIICRRKDVIILTVPVLMVIFTLLISTPVFCEFRYAYCVFTVMPLLIGVIGKRFDHDINHK